MMKHETNTESRRPNVNASGTILLGAGLMGAFGWMFPSLGTLLLLAVLFSLGLAVLVLLPAVVLSLIDSGAEQVRHTTETVRLNYTRRDSRRRTGGKLESA